MDDLLLLFRHNRLAKPLVVSEILQAGEPNITLHIIQRNALERKQNQAVGRVKLRSFFSLSLTDNLLHCQQKIGAQNMIMTLPVWLEQSPRSLREFHFCSL